MANQIEMIRSRLNRLPPAYQDFVHVDGFNGEIGSTYLRMYPVSELESMNTGYEVERWAPGLLLFGDDGGPSGYGFDTRKSLWPVVNLMFVPMRWDEAVVVGKDFSDFLERLRRAAYREV